MKTTCCLLAIVTAMLPACEKSEKTLKKDIVTAAVESPSLPSSPEAIATEVASLQGQLAEIMESIKDVASAEKAIIAVSPVAERFTAIGKVIEGMDQKTSPELDARLKELVKPSEERLQNAMAKAMPILAQNAGLAEKMQSAMSKMSSK